MDVPSRYGSGEFYGIIIDTGAAKRSTAGISQFQAFQRLSPGVSINTTSKGKVTVQFGIGTHILRRIQRYFRHQ